MLKGLSFSSASLKTTWQIALTFSIFMTSAVFAASPVWAQLQEHASLCSYNTMFDIQFPMPGTGLISMLVYNMTIIINNLAYAMYTTIVANMGYQATVRAALTLFIIVYGILFTFGMTQITMLDFVIRVVKFSIVAALLSSGSWNFFYTFVGTLFNDGTNWLINVMSLIAVGSAPGINLNQPFAVIDNAIATVLSAKMFVTLIAVFFTGPYGVIFFGILVLGLSTFVAALFQAMWVYIVALVVRAFLFSLGPIFFAFLLFNRTRHLFDGYINALLSSTLQPVFLFTFFAFFAKLVEASLYKLLRVPVCLTPPGATWQGTPFNVTMWRFMVPSNTTGGNWTWQLYGGGWSFTGANIQGMSPCPANVAVPVGSPCVPAFPMSIVDVLVFLLLVQLAFRFNGIVVNIAKDIAGASLSLNISGGLSEWLSPSNSGALGAAKKATGKFGGASNLGAGFGAGRPNNNQVLEALREMASRNSR